MIKNGSYEKSKYASPNTELHVKQGNTFTKILYFVLYRSCSGITDPSNTPSSISYSDIAMARFTYLTLVLGCLLSVTNAQFGGNFFEQMFQAHGQPQQPQRENAPSHSEHYQREFESGMEVPSSFLPQLCLLDMVKTIA